jgi:uncharacterized membrane protein
LILELKVPALVAGAVTAPALGRALLQQWLGYLSPVTSFFHNTGDVGAYAIFSHVRKCDAWVHFANGCLLLVVIFVHCPISVLAAYLETPAAKAATIFCSGTFIFIAICFSLVLPGHSEKYSSCLPHR